MKKITLLFIALVATLQIQASHIIGGQITSRCLGGLTQEITTTLYVDNQGIPMGNSITVNYNSNNFTWIAFRTVIYSSQSIVNPTTNAYTFIDTITVPYLDTYTFSYTTCCRAANIVNITSASTSFYIETTALVDTTCNSTPVVPVVLFPYVNANSQYVYAVNAYDPDGDSLSYSLVTPLDNHNSPLSGFLNPPATISNTGVLSVYSTVMGTYVFCIKVTEYRNGVEIGHVLREMQIVIDKANGIDEVENNHNANYRYYDILGRPVNSDFNGVKIHNK